MRTPLAQLTSVAALCVLAAGRLSAAPYPDQTKVNLIRNYDWRMGGATTTITAYGPVINGGHNSDQVGPGSAIPMDFDITLKAVRNASKLVIDYSNYWPEDWSIYYSDTGFSGMTLLASGGWTNVDHREYTFPGGANGTPVRYLRFLQTTRVSPADYIRLNEIQLMGATNNTLDDQADGFNLLANTNTRNPVTVQNVAGGDNGNNAINLEPMGSGGYVRNSATLPSYFVIPLTKPYILWGMNLGYYDNWTTTEVHLSEDLAMPPVTNDAGWTLVHTNGTSAGTRFIAFPEPTPARWVRIRFSGGNALTEVELYTKPFAKGTVVMLR